MVTIHQVVGEHQVGFIMFRLTMKKLLNVEQKFTENLFESKLKIIREFGHTLDMFKSP
jgi:hypothetical protein